MKESQIEAKIVEWARKNGWSNLKLNGMGSKGKADRMFMKKGRAVFIEVKKPGGVPTALQAQFLSDRMDDGFEAFWTASILVATGRLRDPEKWNMATDRENIEPYLV